MNIKAGYFQTFPDGFQSFPFVRTWYVRWRRLRGDKVKLFYAEAVKSEWRSHDGVHV